MICNLCKTDLSLFSKKRHYGSPKSDQRKTQKNTRTRNAFKLDF